MGESTWNKRLMGPKLQRVQSFAFASAASRLPGFPASRLPVFPASRLPDCDSRPADCKPQFVNFTKSDFMPGRPRQRMSRPSCFYNSLSISEIKRFWRNV